MNNEELQQELNLQFPSEIAGIKRPTEPVESKHDFFLKMPQLISKDPVLYNKMNLLFSILLSNDNALKQNIDTILGKLDNDYAQLDSPEFSGIPTVPTPEEQDNSKKITNTEWVQAWVKAFVAELSNNIEVETQEDGHFSCPALGMTGLMAQNGYICLGKLFGNLILQWGLSTPKDNGWCSSVAFPISYKNNNYIIIGCGYVNTDDNYFTRGDIFAPNIIQDTRTLNSCLFRSYLQNGQPVVAYIVIGF